MSANLPEPKLFRKGLFPEFFRNGVSGGNTACFNNRSTTCYEFLKIVNSYMFFESID